MSLIVTAKSKAARGSVAAAFENEKGAIDLASIMVGIIVIGLIGGVIAATVFSVIPWAQDNAAKQQLDSVASAQSAYIGLSADAGAATFGGADLTQNAATASSTTTYTAAVSSSGRLSIGGVAPVTQTLFSAPTGTKLVVAKYGSGSDAHYVAAVKSASGARFYITDNKTQATSAGASGNLGAQTTTSGATAAQVATVQTNAAINAVLGALPA